MPIPVISVQQMREWENATWAAGQAEAEVIRRVGQAVAEHALRLTRPGDQIIIVAGKGHNGDDAREAQPHLRERMVHLVYVFDPKIGSGEIGPLLGRRPALVIDGLFGIGLNRALDPAWIHLIEQINQAQTPVLAVDTPSGLNADSGEPQGAAIRAAVTLTVGAPKHGLLRPNAWPYVGRLEVAENVGLAPCPCASEFQFVLPHDFHGFPPFRAVDSHKGKHGHLAVFAGSLGYHGAAVLATRGALSVRPGLVTLFTAENVYVPVASQLQAAMVHPWKPGTRLPESCTAVLFGPGLASSDVPMDRINDLRQIWKTSLLPVIADASALDWLPPGATRPDILRVVTPHPGEAARMLKTTVAHVQGDRPSALRSLSQRYGDCWVALKGHQTLVGQTSGVIQINSSGNPYLAQGGSGDVLAGLVGGLLAQPQMQSEPGKAIRYAVWKHGWAADALTEERRNWTVETLLEKLTH